MKKIYFLLFLICSINIYAQGIKENHIYISVDSLQNQYVFDEQWKFIAGDDSIYALPTYDDSKNTQVKSKLNLNLEESNLFKGIGWFRIHFVADTTITGSPLAFVVEHFGASEIYLDGVLIKKFGEIKDSTHTLYFDPNNLPFIFTLKNAGKHMIAVRYANFDYLQNHNLFFNDIAGFKLGLRKADESIERFSLSNAIITFVYILLAGLFLALSLLHLLLYLYSRNIKSNLYFSIFVFSIATGFIIAFINLYSHSPSFKLGSYYFTIPIIAIICLSLSSFINVLFAKKRGWHFWLIFAIGVSTIILRLLNIRFSGGAIVILIISVSIEAIVTILFAMYKKVKGARIIGVGILFFAAFILTVISMEIINSFDIDDSTLGGQIIIFITLFAIISPPISMSAYLAWSFSHMNKDLQLQLEQVKLLSEKTLEQETEKKRILENQKEELEKQVSERTVELETTLNNLRTTQQQLIESEKMATFGAVATRVAHEILNPLNFVNNFSHITDELFNQFSDAKTNEEKEEIIQDIKTNLEKINHHGKRADAIVKELIEHTRAGTTHQYFEDEKL